MRIGDAIASSSNKSVPVKQPKKVPSSTSSQKSQIKNQSNINHGNQPKTQQTPNKASKGSILAQRQQPDGSVQFLFQADSTSQPKWETKEKILSQYPRIVEKFEKQLVRKQNNSDSKKEEEDKKINGKRKQGLDGEEETSQSNQQLGTKKHCTEESKSQRKDESDIEEVTIQINRNPKEQEQKEMIDTKKVNLIELFRDLKDNDEDNVQESEDCCDEQTKEEAKEMGNTNDKTNIIEENQDNLHQDNENEDQFKSPVKRAEITNSSVSKSSPGEFQKPGMEELVKSAQKKIKESVEKIKKSAEKSRLDVLNEFKFVKNETTVFQAEKSMNYERKASESSAADASENQNKSDELLKNEETAQNLTSSRQPQEEGENQQQDTQEPLNEHSQPIKKKQQSQTKGDFLLGDKVKRIGSCQRKDGILMMEVEWLPREDGTIPKKSIVPSSLFREYDTAKLLDFYESKLSFPDKKNTTQLKKQ